MPNPAVYAEPEASSEVALQPSDAAGRRVLSVERTLRSGSSLRFGGDVLVYGDVNAGAQVLAEGSIVVLGSLRGLAHAGCRGDERATILAFDMGSTQLRIGRRRVVAAPEPSEGFSPMVAWVDDREVVVAPYTGRLPRRAADASRGDAT